MGEAAENCSDAYASHDWQWEGSTYRCGRCGLVDLAARRLARGALEHLERAGWTISQR